MTALLSRMFIHSFGLITKKFLDDKSLWALGDASFEQKWAICGTD
jgi:hypothetical protein